MPALDLDARLTRLEAALVALIGALKAGAAGGVHGPNEHPLDDILTRLAPPQSP